MPIKIKYLGNILEIDMPIDSKISDLKNILTTVTGLLPNRQKIIWKGKILTDNIDISREMTHIVLFEIKEAINISQSRPCSTNGCIFYGKFITDWYCSKCYNDIKIIKLQKNSESSESSSSSDELDLPLQEDNEKCWKCDKRVGLLGFTCKCKYVFCGKHRHGPDHNCQYNWEKYDRKRLEAQNKQFKVEKLKKIS
jgi:hypothetical protein